MSVLCLNNATLVIFLTFSWRHHSSSEPHCRHNIPILFSEALNTNVVGRSCDFLDYLESGVNRSLSVSVILSDLERWDAKGQTFPEYLRNYAPTV